MEKIHAPTRGLTIFALYGGSGGKGKRFLALRADRSSPLIFLSSHRIPVNAQPPASVMRLRKYLSGERVVKAVSDWTARRLWLGFSGLSQAWLRLDLREGPALSFEAPSPPEEPLWPDTPLSPKIAQDAWRTWEVLTPALRRTLPFLDAQETSALLADLEDGNGDVFLYEADDGRIEVSAWPLPREQLEKKKGQWRETVCGDPISALAKVGEHMYSGLAEEARLAATRPFSAEISRLERLLKKLDAEESRLLALQARKQDALLLQSQLYRFRPEEKRESVVLETPEGNVSLELDKSRTVRENMMEFFRQAGKGRRGLEHLTTRREAVRAEKARVEAELLRGLAAVNGASVPAHDPQSSRQAGKSPSKLPKEVQAFRSGDGFLLLRGRDAKGNALALKLASPHDYWLHTAQGESAHVIIRRDHPAQEVPERTLLEAGVLVALKSWQKNQESAQIQYSLAKFIHPMKNAGSGAVRIDRSEGSFRVKVDATLEERLKDR